MTALHTALLKRAEDILKDYYDELPIKEQDRWLDEFRHQKETLRWLAGQEPDEEN
jgi:hypothetical protein